MTISNLIDKYLESRLFGREKFYLSSVHLQNDLVNYSKEKYNILHTPETYIRGWRDFKKTTKKYNIKEVILPIKSKVKTYEITKV